MNFLYTYKFRKTEQDPAVDSWRTCMDDTGYDIARIAKESGVSYSTLSNWENGKTKRPQHCTLTAAVRAMGYDFALVPIKQKANGHALPAKPAPFIKRFRSLPRAERKLAGVSGADL